MAKNDRKSGRRIVVLSRQCKYFGMADPYRPPLGTAAQWHHTVR